MPLGSQTFDQIDTEFFRRKISSISYWVAENARTLRRFLSEHKLVSNISDLEILELDRVENPKELPRFLTNCIAKGSVGICSDAGMPGIADPGAEAVKWAHNNQIAVEPILGLNSITLSLSASGFNGQQFVFHGYSPIKDTELKDFLRRCAQHCAQTNYTQIWIETPYRADRMLDFCRQNLPSNLGLCVAMSLHDAEQGIVSKTVVDWKNEHEFKIGKKPCVFLVGT